MVFDNSFVSLKFGSFGLILNKALASIFKLPLKQLSIYLFINIY